MLSFYTVLFFFFKQKTAYEMRISDWSSDVCSSDLILGLGLVERATRLRRHRPMVMIDLAVPRDIEPEGGRLDAVYLYSVDDLGRLVPSGTDARRAAVGQAEAIDRQSTRMNSTNQCASRMTSCACTTNYKPIIT